MIRIKFINFWESFKNNDNFLTNLLKIYNIEYEITEDNIIDFLIVGCFVHNYEQYNLIKFYPSNVKKILYISEPIEIFYPYVHKLYLENIFNYTFGSVINRFNDEGEQISFKYPLYFLYFDFRNINYYKQINNFVLERDFSKMKDICLINSHDNNNSRTHIYNELKSNNINITCPGKLFNNISNEELNKFGKVEYLKNFIFHICPENTKTELEGYITEKIVHSCISGCIPIYSGSFDEIDEKIFNKNRILFFDHLSIESVKNCSLKFLDLFNDKIILQKFYSQPPFEETAYETFINLENKFINLFRI